MEGYTYKVIPIEKVGTEFPFRTRYGLDDGRLRASIAKYGIRNPLVVTSDKFLIAGHRRFIAAQANGIKEVSVAELQSDSGAKRDLFMLALFLNWDQFSAEIDRIWSIRRAKQDFGLDERTITDDVLPVLGLAPEHWIYELYLKTAGLESSVLELIADGTLPFRGAHTLLRFSPSDQDSFAHSIAQEVTLTTNQLLRVSEWLSDLLRMSKMDLKHYLLKNTELEALLDHPSLDRRGKAECFCQAVRALRFPQLAEREKKFQTLLHQVEDQFDGLSVRAPSSFEEEGITLSARVRGPESLARLMAKIEEQYPLFHSLFDVLG